MLTFSLLASSCPIPIPGGMCHSPAEPELRSVLRSEEFLQAGEIVKEKSRDFLGTLDSLKSSFVACFFDPRDMRNIKLYLPVCAGELLG